MAVALVGRNINKPTRQIPICKQSPPNNAQMHLGLVCPQLQAAPEPPLEVLGFPCGVRGWEKWILGAGIAEEAEASSPAQEAILEQALNARFQAEFN